MAWLLLSFLSFSKIAGSRSLLSFVVPFRAQKLPWLTLALEFLTFRTSFFLAPDEEPLLRFLLLLVPQFSASTYFAFPQHLISASLSHFSGVGMPEMIFFSTSLPAEKEPESIFFSLVFSFLFPSGVSFPISVCF